MICKKLNCSKERLSDDNLFCPEHRQEWISRCKMLGIHERLISSGTVQEAIDKILARFISRNN